MSGNAIDLNSNGEQAILEGSQPTVNPEAPPLVIEKHLFVLVHGLEPTGKSDDMYYIRQQLEMKYAPDEILDSIANENDVFIDIGVMGQNLAEEVVNYIKSKTGIKVFNKISFIGHGLGCVIIRSCVETTTMQPYLQYFYTFLSISGSHLGIKTASRYSMISGVWIFKEAQGSKCLDQLLLRDADDIVETFLYKLSLGKGLSFFSNILLVSSAQDYSVPFYSARVEKEFQRMASEQGQYFNLIVDNILAPLENNNFLRLNVLFPLEYTTTIDNVSGRAAHLELIQNIQFLEMFFNLFSKYID